MFAYKLRVDSCGAAWESLSPPEGECLEEATIKSSGPYRPAPHEDCLIYHLKVAEAGNFVVHGVLVGDAASSEAGRTTGNAPRV